MAAVHAVLTLAIWIGVSALIIILNRIARFYQITSGARTHYGLFWLPVLLFMAGALRYATLGSFVGDPLGDVLMLTGGLVLIFLANYLLRLMTGSRS